jgi:hypothetical protein
MMRPAIFDQASSYIEQQARMNLFWRAKEFSHISRIDSLAIRPTLAVVSFFLYAIVALNQGYQTATAGSQYYNIERSSMAAAVSHIVYGAYIGAVYRGIYVFMIQFDGPVEEKLERAADGDVPTEDLMGHTSDGIGVGYVLFTTLAMRLFGLHSISLVAGFLCLVSLAALAFLLRFKDGRALIVLLYFFSLTAMLITPMGSNELAVGQVPIGGYRFFSLLAVLPLMHIILDFIEEDINPHLVPERRILLALQAIILALTFAVNAAITYAVFPLACIMVVLITLRQRLKPNLFSLAKKIGVMLLVGGVAYGFFVELSPRAYRVDGFVGDLFWHRLFVSYGANPDWPFGNLNEVYSACKKGIPRGLVPGLVDQNGHCVWVVYNEEHSLPPSKISAELYSRAYEVVMRKAFFSVLFAYPREAIWTFFYYKPLLLLDTIQEIFEVQISATVLSVAVAAQIALLLMFGGLALNPGSSRVVLTMAGVLALAAASTCGLYIAAWSNVYNSGDLVCYFFMLIGLVFSFTSALFRDSVTRAMGALRSARAGEV